MTAQLPLRINASQIDTFKPLLPQPLILSSRKACWDNFYFAYHRQSPYYIPETYPHQHTINIYTNPFLARVKINGNWQRKSCATGDIGIFPAQQIAPAAEFEQSLGIIHLYLEPSMLAHTAYESVDADRIEIVQQLQTQDPLIEQLGFSLKRELETGFADSRLYAQSVATLLAVHLLKHYSAQRTIIFKDSGGLPNHKLKTVLSYINEHLEQNISLTEIAALVQLSPHYFATSFKQSVGIAPHQYLIQCRIERAKQLLVKQKLSITEVSYLVGFQSQSHFAKVFRKHVGITPLAYQRQIS
ncbi:AraC family transcriptional regulator [Nostoc sp.]|uniref:AraC family transcriptional regulator n=1 Tax=Nostoc sp. TaxID=1180 RepID=UPI002FFB95B4